MGWQFFNENIIGSKILFISFEWNEIKFYFDIISKKFFFISTFFIWIKGSLDIIPFFRIDLIENLRFRLHDIVKIWSKFPHTNLYEEFFMFDQIWLYACWIACAICPSKRTSKKIWSFESGWSAHEFDVLIMLFDQILLVVTSIVVLFFVRWIFDVFAEI